MWSTDTIAYRAGARWRKADAFAHRAGARMADALVHQVEARWRTADAFVYRAGTEGRPLTGAAGAAGHVGGHR